MRQRYIISKEAFENRLVIREYAALGQDTRHVQGVPGEDDDTLINLETYSGVLIEEAISSGGLVAVLRTRNLFPIGLFAVKIAESVTTLYRSSGDCSAELSFNDFDDALLPSMSLSGKNELRSESDDYCPD